MRTEVEAVHEGCRGWQPLRPLRATWKSVVAGKNRWGRRTKGGRIIIVGV